MYGKKRYYKRKYKKKYSKKWLKPWMKTTAVPIGWLAGMAAKKVADKYLNVEYKIHQGEGVGDTITKTATNTNYYLTGIAQGDTESTRDGYSIGPKSLFIKGTLNIHASATISNVRMILLRDKRPSSTAFTYDQILDTTGTNNDVISMRNIDNTKYCQIMYDKVFKLDNDTRRRVNFKIFKKLKNHMCWKQGVATANYADQTDGKLSLVMISDEATNVPSVDVIWRMRYVDN